MSKQKRAARTPGRPKLNEQEMPIQEIIIQIAAKEFMEQGYESISLQQIAAICGVTKATIYYYYSNKAELFTSAIEYMLTIAHKATKSLMDSEGHLRDRLARVAYIKIARPHSDLETMLKEAEKQLSEEHIQRIRSAEHLLYDLLAFHFEKAMTEGQLQSGSPMLLAHAFSSLLMMGNRDSARELFPSHEQLATSIVDLFWQGAMKQQ
ncbi:TetR/AcrR family transcriptional regulator [Paenibacillus sp. SC116]|uniref:TetR/AcrR family transcriptional regulator n=1 Tax=Paenibacillus sp. SC116 TaxID=2968986 RepID=UPI00215AAA11|nr:TetR/AcrR family transcriptional regulator [Paenibacillus sp. SC116]MCR8846575.1 TetR/AcrR family transcriptional regulator [Paenibacillus sp. SC116]